MRESVSSGGEIELIIIITIKRSFKQNKPISTNCTVIKRGPVKLKKVKISLIKI